MSYDETFYVTAFPIALLGAVLLVGIGVALSTTREGHEGIRRHSNGDRYWYRQPAFNGPSTGVLTAEYERPRHLATEPLGDEYTGELEIMIRGDAVESWPSVGRRARDSIFRHAPVPYDWSPNIGNLRIAILETPTAEYLFARKPKDNLDVHRHRSSFVRNYINGGTT